MESAKTKPSPLERMRRELALAVGENAVFDGWTAKAVESAAGHKLRVQAIDVGARLFGRHAGNAFAFINKNEPQT